ncbi:MAG: YfcE family phosphodiesterase [Armatimonadota bacterium]
MKVALIGDIHGNLPALDAVLAHAQRRDVDTSWNIGDLVGYGPFPNEVIDRVQADKILTIAGNYDLKTLRIGEGDAADVPKNPEKLLAFTWAYEQLTPEHREYLHALSLEHRLDVAGLRVLLTHGSPASNEEHLTPETPDSRLRELAKLAKAEVVICGHSHQPFARKVHNTWFINTGSVGRPDDGDPRACYAIAQFRRSGDQLQVKHYRVDYDIDATVQAIQAQGLPDAFAQVFLQGRSLDNIARKPRSKGADMPEEPRSEESIMQAVVKLAESCRYEEAHTRQVTRLALRLFDELQPLHQYGMQERCWLEYGAMLHDIGWVEGQQSHHKTALRIIRESSDLPFSAHERLIIGSLARYHRKALPAESHDHYASLSPEDQHLVSMLAGILRVADGLDRTHRSLIRDITCTVTAGQIHIQCAAGGNADIECDVAQDKGQLLALASERTLVFAWSPV